MTEEEWVCETTDYFAPEMVSQDEMTEESSPCGTTDYLAPEMARAWQEDTKVRFWQKLDIWSLGVMLFELLFKKLPFSATSEEHTSDYCNETHRNILRKMCKHNEADVSPIAVRVLKDQLLVKDPRGRSSARDLLEHPWFRMSENVDQ